MGSLPKVSGSNPDAATKAKIMKGSDFLFVAGMCLLLSSMSYYIGERDAKKEVEAETQKYEQIIEELKQRNCEEAGESGNYAPGFI